MQLWFPRATLIERRRTMTRLIMDLGRPTLNSRAGGSRDQGGGSSVETG
jgi:hypothetical protein